MRALSCSSQMWIPQQRAMARSNVDLPLPFSPTKKVTGVSKSIAAPARSTRRLKG